ncbi:DUF222 domain-containing protein [Paeniglutamicibacter gangotriensis]|uniref:HNH endonuclease n=1 Tax=Paeniglutamicibacter gangotriensis TaxID=254787 RepID=UPI0037CB9171
MAKKSSSKANSTGKTPAVPAGEVTYTELLARGTDMDTLLREYVAAQGPAGLLGLAAAVNTFGVLADTHEAMAVVCACETLKAAVTATQAEHATSYTDSLITYRKDLGVREKNPGWGSNADIALAMHVSRHRGTQTANEYRILVEDLPRTIQGMRDGVVTWEQVKVIISGIRHLSVDSRRMIDELLWEETHTCFTAGTAKLREMVTYWALILEPAVEEDLEAKAEKDRHLDIYQIDKYSVRISGTAPLEQGIALRQVLARKVEEARENPDDERNASQIGIDSVYEEMTGLKAGGSVPVQLLVVMDHATLGGGSDNPVLLPGAGYISAAKGRKLLAGDPQDPVQTWWRRLFVAPTTGELVAMDSKSRRFGGNLKRFISFRDQYCRTPYCNGAIRDMDHVVQVRKNGKTTAANASARCGPCNQNKEAPGWVEMPVPGDRHSFKIITPSGHWHIAKAPPLLGINTPKKVTPPLSRRPGPQRK